MSHHETDPTQDEQTAQDTGISLLQTEDSFSTLRTIRHILRKLTSKNYYSARVYHRLCLYLANLNRQELLLVFQMGKVGSSTVVSSLEGSGLGMPVYHVHFLSQRLLVENERQFREQFWPNRIGKCRHLWNYQYLRRQVDRGPTGKRWKIVTLSREPIARNISAFFENLEIEFLNATSDPEKAKYKVSSTYGFEVTITAKDIEALVDLFFEKFDHDTPLVFFDRELNGVFGVDVYADEFPMLKGYKIYEGENADVLLIRLESLNDCATDAFREFLGIEEFRLINRNIGKNKAYAAFYREFKDRIVLPVVYLDKMYGSKYMQQFYSEHEIATFRTKWASVNRCLARIKD